MRTFPLSALFVICLTAPAFAQDTPKVEIAAGYSVLHDQEPHANLHGWVASVTGNVNRWLGIVGEFGQNHTTVDDLGDAHYDVNAFMVGPRFALRRSPKVTPFAQVLFGAHHAHVDVGSADEGETSFAWQTGAGLDFWINPKAGIRLGGDFRHIHEDAHQDNHHHSEFRFQAGFVFRFGTR